jgi:hypothetical protein
MAQVNGVEYADFAVGTGIYGTPYLKFQKTYGLAITGLMDLCLIGKSRDDAFKQAHDLASEGNRVEIMKDGVTVDVYTQGQCL